MTGRFEYQLELMGTAPDGFAQATVKVTGGTLAMDRSWAPAVTVSVSVPFGEFDLASWQLIEPTLSAQFARLEISDLDAGRQATWKVNLRGYRHMIGAGVVEIALTSFEALVQDYGRLPVNANYTDTTAWPSSLSIIQDMCLAGAGAPVAPVGDWTADIVGAIGSSNEYRWVVNGTNRWSHIQALAAAAPGGIVQHYGYGNNQGYFLDWLLTHPTYEIAPSFAYQPPPEPDPELGVNQGTAQLIEWQAERSRDAEGWGDAMYVDFPAKQHSGTATFTTSGYVMDYEYDYRGLAGSTSVPRRQAQDTSTPWSTPTETGRNTVASQRLSRAAMRAVGQTFTQPLDTRLLPWQVHPDENGVRYMIRSITHNLGDGTSVVSVNRV